MKKAFHVMVMVVAVVGMMLMFSTKSMAASMPAGEFAGISIEKGSVNNVTYETGGVGIEERAAMDKSVKDYNLRLVFATMKGLYLAGVPVQIKTPDGKVILNKQSNGPWFWAKLPAGTYEVMASYNNKKEVHKVDLSKGPQSVEFTWKQAK
jgi:hypothetical protein